ncbi:DUF3077 domain-containing protein [Pseudomonas entomophila]|uniref:DUF6124 family protein n=1 Tax=Pseudomonas entomophila TaxID=312306 RepID=UPI0015E3ADDE|nr:DUF3077 domain-containing protein [Pseudomonas entomophila]MBA1189300.1 DUF3077 domain-containing protein [Pseudomonas entomophila]
MKPSTYLERDLDSEAARRALDFYLNPPAAKVDPHASLWTLRPDITSEHAQEQAMTLLRCAATTAGESAGVQQGSSRELLLALMHMINMARALLDHVRAQAEVAE